MSTKAKNAAAVVAAGIVLGILIGAPARADFPHFPAKASGGGGGLSPIADQTTLANISGGTANPTATTAAQMRTMLGVKALPLAYTDIATIPNGTQLANVSGSTAAASAFQSEDIVDSGASAVASMSLAAAFGGLNGDADGGYHADCNIVLPASSNGVGFSLKPNNVATNQAGEVFVGTSSAVASAVTTFRIMNAGTVNAGSMHCMIDIAAKSGRVRQFRTDCFKQDPTAGSGSYTDYIDHGAWNDTATNLTDIVIAADSGNNIGAHSICTIRRFVGAL